MINGAHSILYSTDPEADRAFLRDVLAFPSVDVGEGWLIFGLPPAEVAVHPGDQNDVHELYLMCDDVKALVATLQGQGVACDPIEGLGWGMLTRVTLPSGGKLGIYQPRHARPEPMAISKGRSQPARPRSKPAKKTPSKKASSKKAPSKKAPSKKASTQKSTKKTKR
jgi:hypothetical protein